MSRARQVSTPAIIIGLTLVGALTSLLACSSDSTGSDRTNTPDSDGGGGTSSGDAQPAVNNGRDDTKESCLAACQNTAFQCRTKTANLTANLTGEDTGCSGHLNEEGKPTVLIKVNCIDRQVCVGANATDPPSSCSSATFDAFSFGYGPADATIVCTRQIP